MESDREQAPKHQERLALNHADFAVAVTQRVEVTTSSGISGRVIALGWRDDSSVSGDPAHELAATLYLVVDPAQPGPLWVAQGELTSTRLIE